MPLRRLSPLSPSTNAAQTVADCVASVPAKEKVSLKHSVRESICALSTWTISAGIEPRRGRRQQLWCGAGLKHPVRDLRYKVARVWESRVRRRIVAIAVGENEKAARRNTRTRLSFRPMYADPEAGIPAVLPRVPGAVRVLQNEPAITKGLTCCF